MPRCCVSRLLVLCLVQPLSTKIYLAPGLHADEFAETESGRSSLKRQGVLAGQHVARPI